MTDRKPSHLRTAVRSLVAALALSVCAGVAPALAQVATPHWYVITRTAPTYLHPGKTGWITMVIANLGDAPVSATSGNPVEITDTLPKPLMQAGEAVGEVVATEKMKGVADPGTNRSQDKPALSCEALPPSAASSWRTLPAGTAITAELPWKRSSRRLRRRAETKVSGRRRHSRRAAKPKPAVIVPSRYAPTRSP